jgi:hypothetical protein
LLRDRARSHCANPQCVPPLARRRHHPLEHRLNRLTDQRSTTLGGHNLFQPQNQQHNQPAPGKSTPMMYPSTRRDSQRCSQVGRQTMAKQCKQIRPNPSGQPRKPCSHSSPALERPASKMSHPAWRGRYLHWKPRAHHISITKQTHRPSTHSNQITYATWPRRRAGTKAAQPAGEKSQNSAPPGTFWDIWPQAKQDARADGRKYQTHPAGRPTPLSSATAQPIIGSTAQRINGSTSRSSHL